MTIDHGQDDPKMEAFFQEVAEGARIADGNFGTIPCLGCNGPREGVGAFVPNAEEQAAIAGKIPDRLRVFYYPICAPCMSDEAICLRIEKNFMSENIAH